MATVNRRDSILEAATLEFATAGFAGGRIERIAASARVNKQLIFHYFTSKNGLYSAVVLAAVSRFKPPVGSSESAPDALRAAVRSIVESMGSDDMLVAALVDCTIRAGAPSESREAVGTWTIGLRKVIREVIADGQRQGFFRDDIWPDAVAENIVNECLGYAVHRLVHTAVGDGQDSLPSNNTTPVCAWAADYCAWR